VVQTHATLDTDGPSPDFGRTFMRKTGSFCIRAGTAYSEQTDWSREDLPPRRLAFATDVLLDVGIIHAIFSAIVCTDRSLGHEANAVWCASGAFYVINWAYRSPSFSVRHVGRRRYPVIGCGLNRPVYFVPKHNGEAVKRKTKNEQN
jgi:hypothetical protein